jgi:hypothetical protein
LREPHGVPRLQQELAAVCGDSHGSEPPETTQGERRRDRAPLRVERVVEALEGHELGQRRCAGGDQRVERAATKNAKPEGRVDGLGAGRSGCDHGEGLAAPGEALGYLEGISLDSAAQGREILRHEHESHGAHHSTAGAAARKL